MDKKYNGVKTQVLAIVLSAGAAALVTFFQVLASTGGLCPALPATTVEAGALGAGFKAVHTAYLLIVHKSLT